ncbi:tyrosine kinase receptor Cad96Ca-like, partial [Saccoglossus kowalevskii]
MQSIPDHQNVMRLLGCCTEKVPYYVIMDLCDGSLKDILMSKHTPSGISGITQIELLTFVIDIVKGMEHLSNLKIIHRYLASKHVMVSADKKCKIANFSYASDVTDDAGFFEKTKNNRPFQWLSCESLLNRRFTLRSDVWSFGIVLWELVTIGGSPYKYMKEEAVNNMIKNGKRMPKPLHCDNEVYNAMLMCWKYHPKDRPSFNELKHLTELMISDGKVMSSTATWKQIPSDIDVIIGESAELKCALDNLNPGFLPIWFDASTNPATAVSEGETVFSNCPTCSITGTHSNGEYHLTIDPVSLNDEGTWQCNVFDASPQSHDAQLTVLVPASITTSPSDQTVSEGTSTITLQCAATGKPDTISYTWKKGSVDISIGGRYSLNGGSLTISNIVRGDDDIYTCYASNGVGKQALSNSATVTVN